MNAELMALKIPPGWAVCYNRFYDVGPEIDAEGELVNWGCFTQDLLQLARMDLIDGEWQIAKTHLLIDLGWYPDGEAEGEYRLQVVINENWESMLTFCSKDRQKVKAELEELLAEDIFIHPFQDSPMPLDLAVETARFRTFFEENYSISEEDADSCHYEELPGEDV